MFGKAILTSICVLAFAFAGPAVADDDDDERFVQTGPTIIACVDEEGEIDRLVNDASQCDNDETAVTWNVGAANGAADPPLIVIDKDDKTVGTYAGFGVVALEANDDGNGNPFKFLAGVSPEGFTPSPGLSFDIPAAQCGIVSSACTFPTCDCDTIAASFAPVAFLDPQPVSSLPEGFRKFFTDVLIAGPNWTVYLMEELLSDTRQFDRCDATGQGVLFVHISFDPSTNTCQIVSATNEPTFTGALLDDPLFDLKTFYSNPFNVKVPKLP